MQRIFDWSAKEAERTVTVADLKAARTLGNRYTQVTANSAEEAAASEEAGVEMVVSRARNIKAVRSGSGKIFVTAALGFDEAVTSDEILRAAFQALTDGADAIITARSMETVSLLAREDIPVMGHLGLVPRKSTWIGKLRAVGKTAIEAKELFEKFRRLEDAGAFAVECEVIPARVMSEIRKRTGLVTVSLGSGPDADVMFLFTEDVCGDGDRLPRHARAYGRMAELRKLVQEERVKALRGFREDVATSAFPSEREISKITDVEFEAFVSSLDVKTA